MTNRPAIRARVRILGNTGLPNVAGKIGRVVNHHVDCVAFLVQLPDGYTFVADPIVVEQVGDANGREAHVGWLFQFDAYRCLNCKPGPPADERCTKVYESDVTDETCERCGALLLETVSAPNGAEE